MTKHNRSSFSFLYNINISIFKYFFLCISLPLELGFIFCSLSVAQTSGYAPSAPSLSVITSPYGGASSYTVSPSSGWTCPTPTLSISAYGAAGNNWSNNFVNYNSAGNGINNYGLTTGIVIPLGGDYSKNCDDYSKSVLEQQISITEANQRNQQLSLLQQCYWLVENRINLDQDIFKTGAFSSLKSCRNYDFTPSQGGHNTAIPQPEKPISGQIPPSAPTNVLPSSNLILQQQR